MKYQEPKYQIISVEAGDIITASGDYVANNCTVTENAPSTFGNYNATNVSGDITSLFRK